MPLRAFSITIVAVAAATATASALCACKGPGGRIDRVRDALVTADAARVASATDGAPACADGPDGARACLPALAGWLGSKDGFHATPPDNAGAAAAAIVVFRDRRASALPGPTDTWVGVVRDGKGNGADALRLAVARKMVDGGPAIARKIDDDAGARLLMKTVAEVLPAACETYAALGRGVDPKTLPVEIQPDHSACVQKDLTRRFGPGASYGYDVGRAAAGALALWKDTLWALENGAASSAPAVKDALDKAFPALDAITAKIDLFQMPPRDDLARYLSTAHGEAGIPFDGDGGVARPTGPHLVPKLPPLAPRH